jgi:hypothetical protein
MNVACRDVVVRWCIFLQTLQRSGHSKVPPNCPVSLFIRVFVFHDRCMKGQRRSTHWGEFFWAHHPPPPINSLKKDSWGIESYLACAHWCERVGCGVGWRLVVHCSIVPGKFVSLQTNISLKSRVWTTFFPVLVAGTWQNPSQWSEP